jgi:truncated hemoglobin YjbI
MKRFICNFENLDIVAQAMKQKTFLTVAFGSPNNYSGKDMRSGHAHPGLTDKHFDAVMENLASTLKELNVCSEDIQEVAAIAETTRNDVLNK